MESIVQQYNDLTNNDPFSDLLDTPTPLSTSTPTPSSSSSTTTTTTTTSTTTSTYNSTLETSEEVDSKEEENTSELDSKLEEEDNSNLEPFECPICIEDIEVGGGCVIPECKHSYCKPVRKFVN